ncbi:MAG TPA: hypothetical protein VLF91_06405 [Candidatus Saccharimonadales bacterium]|nr:hypothetical protein [Candidatus Saccharimonadales bacterium]
MGRIEDFSKEMQVIRRPPNVIESFFVRKDLVDWMMAVKEVIGLTATDAINRSIGYAAARQLALKHGLQLLFRDHSAVAHELPSISAPFVHDDELDTRVRVSLTAGNGQLLNWMNRERGVAPETTVHDGVRILGAVATNREMGLYLVDSTARAANLSTDDLIPIAGPKLPPFPEAYA